MSDPNEPAASAGPRRVQAVVALRLLEVMRDVDLPQEILEDEDPARTMPRRLGLSDVVERQIRTYKEDARRRVRLSDEEVRGLFRLVLRRPDGEEVFHEAGRLLASGNRAAWRRLLPRRTRFALARVRASRRLRHLFGRAIGGFGRGPFVIEGRALFFIECDPGGDACHLLSGFCQETLEQALGGGAATVTHTLCQSRGDSLCRWEAEVSEPYTRVPTPKTNEADA